MSLLKLLSKLSLNLLLNIDSQQTLNFIYYFLLSFWDRLKILMKILLLQLFFLLSIDS